MSCVLCMILYIPFVVTAGQTQCKVITEIINKTKKKWKINNAKINLLVALNKLKYRNVIKVSVKSTLKFFLEFSTLIFNVESTSCVCLVCEFKNSRNGIMYNVYSQETLHAVHKDNFGNVKLIDNLQMKLIFQLKILQ